ncbi:stress-induced protein KIN2-like isoform X1 [Populus alba x Populus x berolinensis]|nr:stress-induced protein KIN2-like isoform X1 [Populus alba x Populus x berolinensis]
MTDNTQKMSFQAGEAKGQTQEKASNLVDKAGNAAQSAKQSVTGEKTSPTMMDKAGNAAQYAKESVQGAGQQVMSTAQAAVEGKPKMTDNTQKMSFQAGEAKGRAEEKASTLVDKAGNAAQSAKESVLGVFKYSPSISCLCFF